eukprot:CAMPEP_0170073718 /NCGR_PEP_ID=MMETSP0019_2-20121128/11101_1 /TAXON_ID=98059 /ORGANISM="Dinobryon sp., Strain UTEXLB2267" /LENGTH=351 /DNA_ID=CAMNT_0010283459 /DNA_START=163 /DNA_END=1218 /DNA_ORIENTATION=+
MKLQILAAQLYNLTVIPNPSCFMSSEHSTNFLSAFGWEVGLDCLFADVNKTEYSLVRRVPIVIKNQYVDAEEPIALCNAYSKGYLEVQQELQGYTTNNNHGIWAELSKAVLSTAENKNSTVFVIQRSYYSYNLEGYQCSRDFIVNRFYVALKNDNPSHRAISYNREKINIAYHFRYGDTATPTRLKNNSDDVDYSGAHRLPLKVGIELLQKMLVPVKSVLNAAHCVIHFFSEGNLATFTQFSHAFPDTVFHLGNESTALSDLDHMIHADILLGGISSFTSLASALNRWGVKVVPMAYRFSTFNKFAGIDGMAWQHKILAGNLTEFNMQLCESQLYVKQSARRHVLNCNPGQ